MSDYLTNEEIENELKQLNTKNIEKKVITPIVMSFPYTDMDAFKFELLAYEIIKEKKEEYFPNMNVVILPGNKVADKGKDVTILDEHGIIIAIAQCKRYKEKVSIDLLYFEIIKTILNLINDQEDTSKFKEYFFISPMGLSGNLKNILPIKEKYKKEDVDKTSLEV